MPSKWIGSAITEITFPYFLTNKERYPLEYFRMGIIKEMSFFFFDVEDPARNQKPCAEMMQKLKNKVRGLRRKKILNLHKAFTEKLKALYMLSRIYSLRRI